MADVNPETRAIHEQVDRSICRKPAEPDLAELLEPPGQRRVIGDRKFHLQQPSQGTQEPLGLTERKVEDHADRPGRLDPTSHEASENTERQRSKLRSLKRDVDCC